MTMKDVIRFVISWLTGAARKKEWGELTITVQAGQIVFVHEHKSYRDRLPAGDAQVAAELTGTIPQVATV